VIRSIWLAEQQNHHDQASVVDGNALRPQVRTKDVVYEMLYCTRAAARKLLKLLGSLKSSTSKNDAARSSSRGTSTYHACHTVKTPLFGISAALGSKCKQRSNAKREIHSVGGKCCLSCEALVEKWTVSKCWTMVSPSSFLLVDIILRDGHIAVVS